MISIVMAVLNGAKTIGEQLDALSQQTYEGKWELIVVDNGSTDNTVEIVKSYSGKLPHLRIEYFLKKKGKGNACNYGSTLAQGEMLAFCDADDVVSPEWLAAIVRGLGQCDVVTGPLRLSEINSLPFEWRDSKMENTVEEKALDFLPFFSGGNLGIRRTAFTQVGGFSAAFRYQQDVDLSWRLQLAGYQIRFLPEAMIHYRYRDTFLGSWKQLTNYAEAHVLLYKHYREHGMPPSSRSKILNRYKWLLLKAPKFVAVLLSSKTYPLQAKYVQTAALSWGRLRGTLKHRVVYL